MNSCDTKRVTKSYFLILALVAAKALHAADESDFLKELDTSIPVRESDDDLLSDDDIESIKDAPALREKPTLTLRKSAPVPETNYDPVVSAGDSDLKITDFFRRRIPVPIKKIPDPNDGEKMFWKIGDSIRKLNIERGSYSVIRYRPRAGGYFIRYLGRLESDGKDAEIVSALQEIRGDDIIVKESFNLELPPITGGKGFINITTAPVADVSALIEPDLEANLFFSGARQLIAAKFFKYTGGNSVSLGANFVVRRKGEDIGKAMVVDADLDLATLYVFESAREIRAGDSIFVR